LPADSIPYPVLPAIRLARLRRVFRETNQAKTPKHTVGKTAAEVSFSCRTHIKSLLKFLNQNGHAYSICRLTKKEKVFSDEKLHNKTGASCSVINGSIGLFQRQQFFFIAGQ
jgi:hypothetical protein